MKTTIRDLVGAERYDANRARQYALRVSRRDSEMKSLEDRITKLRRRSPKAADLLQKRLNSRRENLVRKDARRAARAERLSAGRRAHLKSAGFSDEKIAADEARMESVRGARRARRISRRSSAESTPE